MTDDIYKAKVAALFQEAEGRNEKMVVIKIETVPNDVREAVRSEFDIWQPSEPPQSLPHWWWLPTGAWASYPDGDRPEMIADKLVAFTKCMLEQQFECTVGAAQEATKKLLEAELHGPLYPAEGAKAFLRRWGKVGSSH